VHRPRLINQKHDVRDLRLELHLDLDATRRAPHVGASRCEVTTSTDDDVVPGSALPVVVADQARSTSWILSPRLAFLMAQAARAVLSHGAFGRHSARVAARRTCG